MNNSVATPQLDFAQTYRRVVDEVLQANFKVGNNARLYDRPREVDVLKRGDFTHLWVWDVLQKPVPPTFFNKQASVEMVPVIAAVIYLTTPGRAREIGAEWRIDYYGARYDERITRLANWLQSQYPGVTITVNRRGDTPLIR